MSPAPPDIRTAPFAGEPFSRHERKASAPTHVISPIAATYQSAMASALGGSMSSSGKYFAPGAQQRQQSNLPPPSLFDGLATAARKRATTAGTASPSKSPAAVLPVTPPSAFVQSPFSRQGSTLGTHPAFGWRPSPGSPTSAMGFGTGLSTAGLGMHWVRRPPSSPPTMGAAGQRSPDPGLTPTRASTTARTRRPSLPTGAPSYIAADQDEDGPYSVSPSSSLNLSPTPTATSPHGRARVATFDSVVPVRQDRQTALMTSINTGSPIVARRRSESEVVAAQEQSEPTGFILPSVVERELVALQHMFLREQFRANQIELVLAGCRDTLGEAVAEPPAAPLPVTAATPAMPPVSAENQSLLLHQVYMELAHGHHAPRDTAAVLHDQLANLQQQVQWLEAAVAQEQYLRHVAEAAAADAAAMPRAPSADVEGRFEEIHDDAVGSKDATRGNDAVIRLEMENARLARENRAFWAAMQAQAQRSVASSADAATEAAAGGSSTKVVVLQPEAVKLHLLLGSLESALGITNLADCDPQTYHDSFSAWAREKDASIINVLIPTQATAEPETDSSLSASNGTVPLLAKPASGVASAEEAAQLAAQHIEQLENTIHRQATDLARVKETLRRTRAASQSQIADLSRSVAARAESTAQDAERARVLTASVETLTRTRDELAGKLDAAKEHAAVLELRVTRLEATVAASDAAREDAEERARNAEVMAQNFKQAADQLARDARQDRETAAAALADRDRALAAAQNQVRAGGDVMSESRIELVALASQVDRLKADLRERVEEAAFLRSQIGEQSTQLLALRNQLSAQTAESTSLASQLAARTSELDSLRAALEARDAECASLRDSLRSAESDAATASDALRRARSDAADASAAFVALRDDQERAEEQHRSEVQTYAQEAASARARADRIERGMVALEASLNEERQLHLAAVTERDEARDRLSAAQSKLAESEASVKMGSARVAELERWLGTAHAELERESRSRVVAEAKVKASEAQRRDAARVLEDVTFERDAARVSLVAAELEVEELRAAVAAQTEALTQASAATEQRQHELEAAVESLHRDLARANRERAELSAELAEAESARAAVANQLADAQARIRDVISMQQESNQQRDDEQVRDHTALQAAVDSLNDRLRAATSTLADRDARLAAAQSEIRELSRASEALTQRVVSLEGSCEFKDAMINRQIGIARDLKDQVRVLESQLTASKARLASFEADHQSSRDHWVKQAETFEAAAIEATEQAKALRESLQTKANAVAAYKEELAKRDERVRSLEAAATAAESERASLVSQLAAQASEAESAAAQLEQAQVELNTVTAKFTQQTRAMEKLRNHAKRLVARIQTLEDDRRRVAAAAESDRAEAAALREELQLAQDHLKTVEWSADQVDDTVAVLRTTNADLSRALEEAVADARTLQDEKAALEAHVRGLAAQVASAGQDSAAYQREAADLRERIAETEAAACAAEVTNTNHSVALNQERTTLRARNADLEQQLADALANNEELEREIAAVSSDLDAFRAMCHEVRVKVFHRSGSPIVSPSDFYDFAEAYMNAIRAAFEEAKESLHISTARINRDDATATSPRPTSPRASLPTVADIEAQAVVMQDTVAAMQRELNSLDTEVRELREHRAGHKRVVEDLQSKAAKLQSNLGEVAAQLHRTKTSRTALEKAALALVNVLHPGAPNDGVSVTEQLQRASEAAKEWVPKLLAAVPGSSAADAASALASLLPFLRLNLSLAPTASLTEIKVALVDHLDNRAPASPSDSFAPIRAHLHATHLDDAQLAAVTLVALEDAVELETLLSTAEKQLIEAESEVTAMFVQREAAEEALRESRKAWDELADAVGEDRKNTSVTDLVRRVTANVNLSNSAVLDLAARVDDLTAHNGELSARAIELTAQLTDADCERGEFLASLARALNAPLNPLPNEREIVSLVEEQQSKLSAAETDWDVLAKAITSATSAPLPPHLNVYDVEFTEHLAQSLAAHIALVESQRQTTLYEIRAAREALVQRTGSGAQTLKAAVTDAVAVMDAYHRLRRAVIGAAAREAGVTGNDVAIALRALVTRAREANGAPIDLSDSATSTKTSRLGSRQASTASLSSSFSRTLRAIDRV
ncbi:hypothetical protein H9P43_002606 [Blastocladiella emersonii ATCC 22665]|nr:hypothetical protein H9P43_002606 [Blastocladiella emersonii ATCC 22665]